MSAETLDLVNDLLQTLRDGKEGFSNASEGVKDAHLKELFARFSVERAKMTDKLVTFASADPDDDKPTVVGTLHRGWIDLKAALSAGNDHAILAECERGEDHAVKKFSEALEESLPDEVRATVEEIAARVKAVHDEVKALRDAA